ncbi:MAG: response regulator transcription factor [Actinomycetota bacterium]
MGHRVVIVDDHPLLAAGLQGQLERSGATVHLVDPTARASRDPEVIVATVADVGPDCAVVDLGLPIAGGGTALIGPLVDRAVPVAVLTGETDRRLLARTVGLGASAVLGKSEPLSDIVDTILRLAAGEAVQTRLLAEFRAERQRLDAEDGQRLAPFAGLSPREQQVLAGLMQGQAPALLAEQNFVSVATVRTQIKSLLRKLGVGSQLEAVALANRCHWRPDANDGFDAGDAGAPGATPAAPRHG